MIFCQKIVKNLTFFKKFIFWHYVNKLYNLNRGYSTRPQEKEENCIKLLYLTIKVV